VKVGENMLFGNNQQQNSALNLGAPTNSPQQPFGFNQQPPSTMQNFGQSAFGGSMMQGMGMNPGMMQQPITPPSEAEIQLALMRSVAPMDRFVASAQMATLVQMLNDLVSFSVLEVMKNATFVINEDDGTMKMDVTSLPSNLQTMSAENVTNQFNQMQSASQQNIQQMEMQQQQILAMAQQSMMGGALQAALADEGMMQKVGGGVGSFARSMMGGR
tara:strand:- start:21184 stop:21831 length:648 start_codon:yes stop_codon:yes gene_type:complete